MLIIVGVGLLIAYLLKVILRSILRLLKFDRLSQDAGATDLLTKAALPSSTELLCRLVFWVVFLGFVLVGLNALQIVELQDGIATFFRFLPRAVCRSVDSVFRDAGRQLFLSRAALLAAVNSNLPSARLLSQCLRVIIVFMSISMAFEELGIAHRTILAAFTIMFGSLMVGLAIAFGLGGRHLARQFLQRRFSAERLPAKKEEGAFASVGRELKNYRSHKTRALVRFIA